MIESTTQFHNRSKLELFCSMIDDIESENAAANYLFSKANMVRHGLFVENHADHLFTYASNEILKGRNRKWATGPFRNVMSEITSTEPSHPSVSRMEHLGNGKRDPRIAHSQWPGISDSDESLPFGSLSPWDCSPLLDGEEFGDPAWAQTLVNAWSPIKRKDGSIINHHKKHLEPGVIAHEQSHKDSWAQQPSHMGQIDGKGFEGGHPSELYEANFRRWLAEAASKEQLEKDEFDQRQEHLATYRDVWTGKIRDPLDPHDTGSHNLGMLGYGFGLEWLTPSQRDEVISHLYDYGLHGHQFIDKDGDDDSGTKMPHIPQPWFTRNWMGRMIESAIHQSRGMSTPGSMLPATHHGKDSTKENYRGRHINDALNETLVYDSDKGEGDVLRPKTKQGQVAHGYFGLIRFKTIFSTELPASKSLAKVSIM